MPWTVDNFSLSLTSVMVRRLVFLASGPGGGAVVEVVETLGGDDRDGVDNKSVTEDRCVK